VAAATHPNGPARGVHAPDFISAGRMTVRSDWSPLRHSHPFTEVMVMLAGTLRVVIGDVPVVASAGEVLHYPPESAHLERVVGEKPAEFVFFSRRTPLRTTSLSCADARGRMRMLGVWLVEEAAATHAMRDAMVEALLAALVAELEVAASLAAPTMADAVRHFLRDALPRPLRAEDLAREAHLSRAHFIRTYKRLTGLTPMQDLRRMRVEAARDLIITTDLPLKAIAARVGLKDEHHLSHVFRRVMGVAPGHFRFVRPAREMRADAAVRVGGQR
jgi:AraC-like DNA-binding protein